MPEPNIKAASLSSAAVRVVLSTAPSPEVARELARVLVDERLAACVNVLPTITSIYSWRGERCEDSEALLLIKTALPKLEALSSRLRELHSYDVPEFIALTPQSVEGTYLAWLLESCEAHSEGTSEGSPA